MKLGIVVQRQSDRENYFLLSFWLYSGFNGLGEAHPHWGGPSGLLSLLTQMLTSSKNTLRDTPPPQKMMFNCIAEHLMAQSSRCIKLTITDVKQLVLYTMKTSHWGDRVSQCVCTHYPGVTIDSTPSPFHGPVWITNSSVTQVQIYASLPKQLLSIMYNLMLKLYIIPGLPSTKWCNKPKY